jgi:hypothetical protein
MSVYMKHNDLASVTVRHLKINRDDYLPHVGVFGGDDTHLTICMDCGMIQEWKPITDAEIKAACRRVNDEGDDEDEVAEVRRKQRAVEEPLAPVSGVETAVVVEQQRIENELREGFGDNWRSDQFVVEFLKETADNGARAHSRIAMKRILKGL